jgi:hypothetical protein
VRPLAEEYRKIKRDNLVNNNGRQWRGGGATGNGVEFHMTDAEVSESRQATRARLNKPDRTKPKVRLPAALPPVLPKPPLPADGPDATHQYARAPYGYQVVRVHPKKNTYEYLRPEVCRVCGNALPTALGSPFTGMRECLAHLKWEVMRPQEHQCAQVGCNNHCVKPDGYNGMMVCVEHLQMLSTTDMRRMKEQTSIAMDRVIYNRAGYPLINIALPRNNDADGGY